MNDFIALCAVGAEPVLTKELKILGFKPYNRLPGRVFFTSEEKDPLLAFFKANYFLRTADRVFLLINTAKAENFDDLFDLVFSIDWHNYFPRDARITIDKVRTYKSKLSSEHAVQSIVHKAVCDKLCKKWNMHSLPETGTRFMIRIYIENNNVYVCLDLSGEPLYRRGYRLSGGAAPMRETLAAVLIQLMQWKRKIPLHDAFCGSGTIPIEAAWYAYNIPPGIARHFAFERFICFEKEKIESVLKEEKERAASQVRTDCLARITGSDISEEAVSLSKANAERACIIAGRELHAAGITHHIERPDFIQSDFSELEAPYERGILLSNPPYGERLGSEEEAFELYKRMAEIPRRFPGWKLGFITSKKEFEKIFCKQNKDAVLKKHNIRGGNMETVLYIME
ncbi:class I SAM-dependent RNA methyltransferase [Treponema sp. OMZ 788]|uniref:THUMP domain-containing class I SAM-dependent RNA methyltransferase n=1 Tax=Treponema sp. OMZ 788 TaxID=2563664 RepID=UPI0020A5B602|nr:class I SAM-dependent RNA methyltransferase [Treponema sp. OMZ 788]UTC64904.1 class I SAM-dependent RNA methyltransferase [Treponema sp. OMZ 788]